MASITRPPGVPPHVGAIDHTFKMRSMLQAQCPGYFSRGHLQRICFLCVVWLHDGTLGSVSGSAISEPCVAHGTTLLSLRSFFGLSCWRHVDGAKMQPAVWIEWICLPGRPAKPAKHWPRADRCSLGRQKSGRPNCHVDDADMSRMLAACVNLVAEGLQAMLSDQLGLGRATCRPDYRRWGLPKQWTCQCVLSILHLKFSGASR